jgi:hypothetical protein
MPAFLDLAPFGLVNVYHHYMVNISSALSREWTQVSSRSQVAISQHAAAWVQLLSRFHYDSLGC